ncbi:hypothetical protein [Pseudomonas sp. 24 R 17]|nr:hypothetical protein [Pseudomonas sp. 24 R 17]
MIEYLTLLLRASETNVVAFAWPEGNRCAHEKFRAHEWESWWVRVSDTSFNSRLTVCKSLSESS